jgi:long-chain-fatty-acid--CoA ligase ACSBG
MPCQKQQEQLIVNHNHNHNFATINFEGPAHVAEIEKKTKETVDAQGWLHSGDKGCMDNRGMFRVTGRYKELLIGAGGENIAPVPIEDSIKALCPAISNVMMVGDKMPFNCLLVTLKATGDL